MVYVAGHDSKDFRQLNGTLSEYIPGLLTNLKQSVLSEHMTLVLLADGLYLDPKYSVAQTQVIAYSPHPPFNGVLTDVTREFVPQTTNTRPAIIDSGDDYCLVSFAQRACALFDPNDQSYRMLSIVGHGGGWGPTYNGPIQPNGKGNGQPGWSGLCLDITTGSSLSTIDLARVLDQMGRTLPSGAAHQGQPAIDVLFLDACLMGMLEVAYEIRHHAKYLVAAQSQLWGFLRYDHYLSNALFDPTPEPYELARSIVTNYQTDAYTLPFALSAIDLSAIEDLAQAVHRLAQHSIALIDQHSDSCQHFFDAYLSAQKFDYSSDGVLDSRSEAYVDLLSYAKALTQDPTLPAEIASDAQAIIDRVGIRRQCESVVSGQYTTVPQFVNNYTTPDGTAIVYCRTKTTQSLTSANQGHDIQSLPDSDLGEAYGLSIYMPFGRRDARPYVKPLNTVNDDHLRGLQPLYYCGQDTLKQDRINHLRYYYTGNQLAFLGDPYLKWDYAVTWEHFLHYMEEWRMRTARAEFTVFSQFVLPQLRK